MYEPGSNRYEMMNGGGWMAGFVVLTLFLLAVALIGVLVNLYLHVSARHAAVAAVAALPEARQLLDRRLARGEISAEDYRALRALMES